MARDPGAPDDKGKNKGLNPPDEIVVTTDHDPKAAICLSGSSSSPGPSDDMSGVPKCDMELKVKDGVPFSEVKEEFWFWELLLQKLPPLKLHWEPLFQKLPPLNLHWEPLFQKLPPLKLRQKLGIECFVPGTSSATGKISVSSSISHYSFSHSGTSSAGKDGNIEMGLGPTVHPPVPTVTTPNVSDETTSEPSQASDSSSSHGGKDSGTEMVLSHTPTMPNVSDETTLELSQASDSCSSHNIALTSGDIEMGRMHSSDPVPIEPISGDPCSYHNACEPNSQRLPNPLFAEITQIGCALVAFKTSDGSSPAKDVLFYLLVFICVLGFLYTLAGKWFHCTKMAVIGLVATALGFLMTMALVVMYKIR